MRLLNEKVNFWLCFCCPKCRLFAFVLRFEAFREERERETLVRAGAAFQRENPEKFLLCILGIFWNMEVHRNLTQILKAFASLRCFEDRLFFDIVEKCWPTCEAFLRRSKARGKKVLVNCKAGHNRSACMCALASYCRRWEADAGFTDHMK